MINEQEIRINAAEAQELIDTEVFQKFCKIVRDEQLHTFANSSSSEVELREECAAIMRALNHIDSKLQSALTDQAIYINKKD